MQGWGIHIEGQVQGVGFRPTVARLAHKMNIAGDVCNTSSGVDIRLFCSKREQKDFLIQLKLNIPPKAIISSISVQEILFLKPISERFSIMPSSEEEENNAFISPDFGVCENCQNEVLDLENHRYFYPFISCADCGPRYSIIKRVPYDRHFSSMGLFEMCTKCNAEYKSPIDRRFHSQTNSCKDCAIELDFFPKQKTVLKSDKDYLVHAVKLIQQGKIVAVKGTGGFLLLADATSNDALSLLRKRKNRPKKPFAIMLADEKMLKEYFLVNVHVLNELLNPIRPIVLCNPRSNNLLQETKELIAPGLSSMGVCLPADSLLFLISKLIAKPIIATSANLQHSPLEYQNESAVKHLHGIADAILYHNREIYFPQDDSVCKFSQKFSQKIILRRGKGMSPTFWNSSKLNSQIPVLALGADIKSTFAVWNGNQVYISQYLGDLASFDTQERYLEIVDRFFKLTGIRPQVLLLDQHPLYYSRGFKDSFSNAKSIDVPHHEAHFAALLWEHDVMFSEIPILGVVWDGLGYGNDSQLWGGEFFVFKDGEFERTFTFDSFDYILGDKMSSEPRLAALSLCCHIGEYPRLVKEKFTEKEWVLYTKILAKGSNSQTSSVGRIFDAVASILGLCDFNGFEGEAAMLLEKEAQEFFDLNPRYDVDPYGFEVNDNANIIHEVVVSQIICDKKNCLDTGLIAARFHLTLVRIVAAVAKKTNCQTLGFSGGVFQNSLLIDLLIQELGGSFKLLFHSQLSPNDESISLGQLAWYHIKNKSQEIKTKAYVFGDSR